MRGLSMSTIFLGVCLIDPGSNFDARAALALVRGVIFFIAVVLIWCGA